MTSTNRIVDAAKDAAVHGGKVQSEVRSVIETEEADEAVRIITEACGEFRGEMVNWILAPADEGEQSRRQKVVNNVVNDISRIVRQSDIGLSIRLKSRKGGVYVYHSVTPTSRTVTTTVTPSNTSVTEGNNEYAIIREMCKRDPEAVIDRLLDAQGNDAAKMLLKALKERNEGETA